MFKFVTLNFDTNIKLFHKSYKKVKINLEMAKILMTEKQATRQERNNEIVAAYKALKRKYPDSSINLITAEIAKNYPLTPQGIRAICKHGGVC